MPIIFAGKSKCAKCGQILKEGDDIVGLPFYQFFDEGYHKQCYENWDKKDEIQFILRNEIAKRGSTER